MAWSQEFPGAALVGERTETAFRLPMGVVSPLWAMFGAAASAGVAYWWMTRWTRAAVNFEALAAFAPKAALETTPIEIIAEPVAALGLEATLDDMAATIHAHPTVWEAMGDAFNSVRGLSINY